MIALSDFFGKLKWGLLILISGFFIFVSVKAIVGTPGTSKALKSAVWVEDGKVHPENEGKLVAVVLYPDELNNTADTDMNLTFNQPVVRRTVQQLNWDGERYVWQSVNSTSDEWLKDAIFIGTEEGEDSFSFDSNLFLSLSTSIEFGEDDYTRKTYQQLTSATEAINYGGYLWFSEAPYACMDDLDADADDDAFNYYAEYEGARRIRYNGIDMSDLQSLVVIGYQKDSYLVKAEDMDALPLYENVSTLDEVLSQYTGRLSVGIIVVDMICLGLICLSIYKIKNE